MANYTPTFTKPYPSGWVDKPSKTTPATAAIMNSYDTAIAALESYLRDNAIKNVSASTTVKSGTKIATITIDGTEYAIYAPNVSYESAITGGTKVGTITVGSNTFDVYAPASSAGGSTVSVVPKTLTGTNIAEITVDGTTYQLYAPTSGGGSGSTVTAEATLTEGTQIGKITIDGVETILYAQTASQITVDAELSATSENPVQNKVVKAEFGKVNNNLDGLGYGENTGSGNLFREEYKNDSLYVKKSQYQSYLKTNIKGITKLYATVKLKGTSQSNYSCSIGNTDILDDKRFLNYGNISIQEYDFGVDDDVYIQIGCSSGVDVNTFFENYEIIISDSIITSDTQYKPYIPSVKMLAEENTQQFAEMMDIKMLGWSVPKECPIQNEVNGNQFVQKVGRYNLWEFSWGFVPKEDAWGAPYYYCYLSGLLPKMPDSYDGVPNMFCQKYKVVSWNAMGSGIDDTICLIHTANSMRIKDTTYTNLADFKQAMQGQYLYYELDTPITKTIDGNEKAEQIDDSLTSLGKCKNLLKHTLQTTTQNGVTCTNNGDGTYTLNGTATKEIDILIGRTIKTFKKNTKLKIAGMPTTGRAFIYDSFNSSGEQSFAYGFEGKEYQTNIEGRYSNCNLHIPSGASLSNVIIRPMITTNLNATYDDFVPYTGDGDTLTHDVANLKNDLSNIKDGTTPAAKAVADEDGNNIKSTYVKKTEAPSGSIVDSELSETSTNPVQNKIVTAKLTEVFQSVSNGKSLIASAITDKGITTAEDATFQVMADNIGKISVSGSAEVSNSLSMIGNYNFKSKIVLADELSADNIAITKDSTSIQITSVEKTSDTNFKVTGDFSAISVGDVIKVQTNPGFFFDANLRSISDVSVDLSDSRFKIDNPGLASIIKLGDCMTGYYAYSAKQPTDDYWAIGMFAKTQGFIVAIVVSTISEYAYVVTSNYINTPSDGQSSLVYDDGKTYYFNTGIVGAQQVGFDTITNNIVPIYKVDDNKFTNNVQGWTYMAKKLLDFYFGKEEFPQ